LLSKRNHFEGSYDDTVRRRGKFVAGTGRGKITVVQPLGLRKLTTQAALLSRDATPDELRGALRREANAHSDLRRKNHATKRKLGEVYKKLDSAAALLMADSQYDDPDTAEKKRKVAVSQVIGPGFSDTTGSYFRKTKA